VAPADLLLAHTLLPLTSAVADAAAVPAPLAVPELAAEVMAKPRMEVRLRYCCFVSLWPHCVHVA
jgi:hypothetical protein